MSVNEINVCPLVDDLTVGDEVVRESSEMFQGLSLDISSPPPAVSNDRGVMFFTSEVDEIGSFMDVGDPGTSELETCLDDHLANFDLADFDSGLLLEDAKLLEEDEEDLLIGLQVPPAAEVTTGERKNPKFHMRIQQPGVTKSKEKRGRPSKAETAARALLAGVPGAAPKAGGSKVTKRTGRRPKRPALSDKAKALRKKVASSTWGKVSRERRNSSVELIRNIIPGVGNKLDTAGVLELAIKYILFMKKKTNLEETDNEFKATLSQ